MKQACLLTLFLMLVLPGCGATSRDLSAQNDELRQSNLELERAVADLNEQLARRERELAAAQGRPDAQPIDGVTPPRLAGIELDRLTGVLPSATLDAPAELRVYLRPIDQDGRVTTAAGEARVRLIQTPSDGDPAVLLDQRYTPEQFHASYRDGITGTHYTLKATLPAAAAGSATLHVSFTDSATGRAYTAERTITLR
jgi:hypothetical protein